MNNRIRQACIITLSALSLQISAQVTEPCLTEIMFREKASKDPSLLLKRDSIEKKAQDYISQHKDFKTSSSVRVVPVVFHIIHEWGPENISSDQVKDQLRILNEDYRRLNADASGTPAPFQSIAADCKIEFRLASVDPNGNCTDGIVRVFSSLTNGPADRDDVKGLSYWDSNKYLNIWVVKYIDPNGASGTVLGYAQFPGFGSPSTDGVVMRADQVGTTGYAAGTINKGRVATHEIGHWLGLRHIWGDASCGDDWINDTPVQQGPSSGCPSFPHVSCGNAPDGDMYCNYMDYSSGQCENTFTAGQKNKMDAILGIARSQIVSTANAVATGISAISVTLCTPVPDFTSSKSMVCTGDSVTFSDHSWNADTMLWQWSFPGGTPSVSSAQNPVIYYLSDGFFDATLTVSNSAGSKSLTKNSIIYAGSSSLAYPAPYSESFEGSGFPGAGWRVENPDGKLAWEQTGLAASAGSFSARLKNYNGIPFAKDALISPAIDLSAITADVLTFYLAFAQTSASSNDRLIVYASTDCGENWMIRYNKSGSTLATTGLHGGNFIPGTSDWRQETISIVPYVNSSNVRFKFEFTSDNGNNIYIDNFSLSGISGISQHKNDRQEFYPNPSAGFVYLNNISPGKPVRINVYDISGREVKSIRLKDNETQVSLHDLADGLYYYFIRYGNEQPVKNKFVLLKNRQ